MDTTDSSAMQAMDERIDRYLTGKMTQEEEARFEHDVRTDGMLRSRAGNAALLARTVRTVMREQEEEVFSAFRDAAPDPQAVKENAMPAAAGQARRVIPFLPKAVVTAAAAGLCLFAGNRYLLSADVMGYIEGTDVSLGIARGATTDRELPALFDSARNGRDMPATISRLSGVFARMEANDDQDAATVGWYLAVAYVRDGDKDAAMDVLQRVITLNPRLGEAWELRDRLGRTFFWE